MLRSSPLESPTRAIAHDDEKKTQKKKSMERFSRLLSKKNTKRAMPPSSLSSLSLSFDQSPPHSSHLEYPPARSTSLRSPDRVSMDERHPARDDRQCSARPAVQVVQEEKEGRDVAEAQPLARSASTRSTPPFRTTLTKAVPSLQPQAPPQPPTAKSVAAELSHYRNLLEAAEQRRDHCRLETTRLSAQLDKITQTLDEKREDRYRMETKVRERRATGDDTDGIRTKIRGLKESIRSLAADLAEGCDAANDGPTTTAAFRLFWSKSNLETPIIRMEERVDSNHSDTPTCLPPRRIRMLTEKFIMDVLMYSLFVNLFSGLRAQEEEKAYRHLNNWFLCRDAEEQPDRSGQAPTALSMLQQPNVVFTIQLRQEVANILEKKPELQTETARRLYHTLYKGGLCRAFQFMKREGEADRKRQSEVEIKVRALVSQAIALDVAIKGHEDGIFAAHVAEGGVFFDPSRMTDEDDQTSGKVIFCICPPFVNQFSIIIEKGHVLCARDS